MTLTERKKKILCNMKHLLDAREYLLANNKSLETQMEIKNNLRLDIEIESPLAGGTTADWIRLYDDGDEEGKVIAKINLATKEVEYIDSDARYDEYAQEVISEVLENGY